MNRRRLASFVAIARLSIGAGFLLAPELTMRPWIGEETSSEGALLLARVVGGRDLVLGAGSLTARGPEEPARWLAAGLIADAADLALTIAYRRVLPRRGAALVCAVAAGGVGLGALALSSQPSRPPRP